MTEEAKKRPLNRLQSMYALRALVDKQYKASQEAKKEGRPVAWCMVDAGLGSPLLDAMGVETVWPENYGPVCAASGAAAGFLERADAEGFPTHLCGYCRNSIGYTARMMKDLGGEIPPEAPAAGAMPKPTLLVATGRTCDAHSKFIQALGRYMDTPVWIIEQPHPGMREELMEGAYEHDVKFMVKELREFAAFLERLLSKKMDWDRLEKIVDGRRGFDKVWYEVNELRKARPGPMHARDFWSSISASMFGGATDPKEIEGLYRNMYDEVKHRVDNKIAGINRDERYRLTFEGLPPWHSLGFFDQLAERGWNFVTESAYHPPKPRDLSMISDPIERLVRHRVPGLARRIDDNFEPEDAARIKEEIKRTGFSHELSVRDVRDYQCDGAFLHPLITCRATSTGLPLLQHQLMEVWKVPSLVIEGDIVDVRLFDPVDALRKAEAFEETMDHYRSVRKEEGLEW